MSAPKLIAKFRIKDNVPFSIETFSGKIFRCGVCGEIFFLRDELEYHLPSEKNMVSDNLKFPELNKNISISIIYSEDIREITNRKYPKVKNGDAIFIRNKP